jgi:hypothetical protein
MFFFFLSRFREFCFLHCSVELNQLIVYLIVLEKKGEVVHGGEERAAKAREHAGDDEREAGEGERVAHVAAEEFPDGDDGHRDESCPDFHGFPHPRHVCRHAHGT